MRKLLLFGACLVVGACNDAPGTELATPVQSNPEYVDLVATAITEAIAQVGAPWATGEGGTVVLETEPLNRMYPIDPDIGPSQADVRVAFSRVAQSLGLATREGLQQDFMRCEDRPGIGGFCEMDERTLLIAPGFPEARANGGWTLTFSTKHMVAEGDRAWRTHLMQFDREGDGWSKTYHGIGYVN